jgi:hypothetical protein
MNHMLELPVVVLPGSVALSSAQDFDASTRSMMEEVPLSPLSSWRYQARHAKAHSRYLLNTLLWYLSSDT